MKQSRKQLARSFVIGDLVTWKSQASGSSTTKRGRVIEVVPAQHAPSEISHTGRRDHESYVVEVAAPKKRGGFKRTVYWPNRAHLRVARRRMYETHAVGIAPDPRARRRMYEPLPVGRAPDPGAD